MNKNIFLCYMTIMMVVISNVVFTSCSKDDDNDNSSSNQSLVGSKWTITHLEDRYVMEFTTDKNVILYEADDNFNYANYLKEGTYSIVDNKIKFSNRDLYFLRGVGLTTLYQNFFKTAEINGNTLKLTTDYIKTVVNFDDYTSSEENLGENSFSMMKVSK